MEIVQANPAAGADFAITQAVAANARVAGGLWVLKAVHAKLVTSAVVATRIPRFQIVDPSGNIAYEVTAAAVGVTASQSVVCALVPGVNIAQVGNGGIGYNVLPIPADLELDAGWRVQSITTAIDVGDQWSQVTATIADR